MTRGRAARAASLLRTRWLVRAPIWLYRARLGMLFGSRLLLLEHVGRKTGQIRRVVLEVVDRSEPGRYVVVSGFGTRAQWFKNVLAHPDVRVQVGSRAPRPARARQLAPQEAAAALDRYAAAHPRAWAGLRPVLEETLGARIERTGSDLPMVALQLSGPTRE
ncbi:MAG TPA: nitroreductase family deazaflavin-dependent oxidoreductase [Jatrophihabitans sp.]|nr:nitroreductase family deazaflavin-dependent oxidoreductase [Jatrophihabitans sp.]